METARSSLEKIKGLLQDRNEVSVDEARAALSLAEPAELEAVVRDSRLYEFGPAKDKIVKRQIVRFKLVLLKSEEEISQPVASLFPAFEAIFTTVPYLRFNKTKGHLVVFEEDFLKVPDIWAQKVRVAKNEEGDQVELTLSDPAYEDRRVFSNEHGRHMEGILKSKYGKHVHFAIDGISVFKNGIYLGVQKFKSLKDLKSVFGKLLKNGKVGERIENPENIFLRELLKFHTKADEKLRELDHFEIGFHPDYKETKCFLIVKPDGSKEDFSFNKCIKQISALING